MIKYKGYIGVFAFDEKANLFDGKVSNTDDLIIFQGKSIEEVRYAFRDAINEYVQWCRNRGVEPEKPQKNAKPIPP